MLYGRYIQTKCIDLVVAIILSGYIKAWDGDGQSISREGLAKTGNFFAHPGPRQKLAETQNSRFCSPLSFDSLLASAILTFNFSWDLSMDFISTPFSACSNSNWLHVKDQDSRITILVPINLWLFGQVQPKPPMTRAENTISETMLTCLTNSFVWFLEQTKPSCESRFK